jgi:hypothetical protein
MNSQAIVRSDSRRPRLAAIAAVPGRTPIDVALAVSVIVAPVPDRHRASFETAAARPPQDEDIPLCH